MRNANLFQNDILSFYFFSLHTNPLSQFAELDGGCVDITYNTKRNLLALGSLRKTTAYHLYHLDKSDASSAVSLLRKAKPIPKSGTGSLSIEIFRFIHFHFQITTTQISLKVLISTLEAD
mgnify:FL=1